MDWARRLFTFEFREHSHLFVLVRGVVYALAAGMLGWLLGRVLASPSHNLIASLVFVGVCVLITLRYPLRGLLLMLILHPFEDYLYLNIDLGAGIPDINLWRVIVVITFMLILAKGATGRRPFLPLTWIDVSMGVAGIGLGIAAVRGASLTSNLQWLFDMYLTPYIIYYVTKNLTTNRSRLQRVLWGLAFIGAYNGIYGIYTVTTGNILFVGEDGVASYQYSENLRIMRGLLGAPHVFGLVFSLAIPVDFYLLIKAPSRGKKILCALILVVTMGGLFFTYKRTAWIATVASFLVIQFFFPRFRNLFLVLLVLAVGIMAIYSDRINESAVVTERVTHKTETLNGRLDVWKLALKDWGRAPILGYGLGQFVARRNWSGSIESNYLWVLVDAGLVGFIPFILVLVVILKTSIRLYRAKIPAIFAEPDLVVTFWGSFVAYVVCLSTVIMNHELPHALLFLLAGAVVGSQEAILDQHLGSDVESPKVKGDKISSVTNFAS